MKKRDFLCTLLMLLMAIGAGKAQTYSLNELTPDQFASGGTDEWSFERHDVNVDSYTKFSEYGDGSTAVNYFDAWLIARFNLYPIMNPPETGDQFPLRRNAWYDKPNEFVYIAAEYPKGTQVRNLTYGTDSYPDELCGYEVYSLHTGVNAAITFTVPKEGYYRVDMKVMREDLWNKIKEMKVYQFFRYSGEGTAYSMGRDFYYGKSQEIDCFNNQEVYNEYLAKVPESPVIANPTGVAFRGLPTGSTANYYYFYAKEGDKISFEADARSTENGEASPRGAYARTKWLDLTIEEVDEAIAKADPSFVDPYGLDQELFDELYEWLVQATTLFGNEDDKYSWDAVNSLIELVTYINLKIKDDILTSMEIPSLIVDLKRAIDIVYASEGGLKVRYTFDNVADGIVPDASGSGNVGTLLNNASIKNLGGKFNVLDLGNDNGYLDMGAEIGKTIQGMRDYTISTYYRVDQNAPFSGNGFMLFAFSTAEACGANTGEFIYYRVPAQLLAASPGGWNGDKENRVSISGESPKGKWIHLAIQQKDGVCTIYINGEEAVAGELIYPAEFYTMPTAYNWIGRPPFGGDNYLKQTMVYDFRVYNYAVSTDLISGLAEVVDELEEATNYGDDGDYTRLNALITDYTTIVDNVVIGTSVGQYTQENVDEFKDAIAEAREVSTSGNASQIKIDAAILVLEKAYSTFQSSVNYEMNELPEGEYYITVNDSYYLTNPGKAAIADGQGLTVANNGLKTERISGNESQVWQLTKVTSLIPPRYSIYSALDEEGIFRHLTETAVFQSTWGVADDDWRTVNILYNGSAYAIQNAGRSASKGDWNYDAANEKLTFGAKIPYIFNFIPFTGVGVQDVNNDNGILIYPVEHAILVQADKPVNVSIYSVSGTLIHETTVSGKQQIPVQTGLYIVKVQGGSNTVQKVAVQ